MGKKAPSHLGFKYKEVAGEEEEGVEQMLWLQLRVGIVATDTACHLCFFICPPPLLLPFTTSDLSTISPRHHLWGPDTGEGTRG